MCFGLPKGVLCLTNIFSYQLQTLCWNLFEVLFYNRRLCNASDLDGMEDALTLFHLFSLVHCRPGSILRIIFTCFKSPL